MARGHRRQPVALAVVLDEDERARLEDTVIALILYKRWEAANGFELTDEIRLTIAAQAALLVLGFDDDEYTNVDSIIVHPTTMVAANERPGPAGTTGTRRAGRAPGRSALRRPRAHRVGRRTRSARRHPEHGHNVVFHEFAHKLDMLDGLVDGTPPLDDEDRARPLGRGVHRGVRALRRANARPAARRLRRRHPGEFFAVATEVFFDQPSALAEAKPRLYEVLRDFYRQDPRQVGAPGGRYPAGVTLIDWSDGSPFKTRIAS